MLTPGLTSDLHLIPATFGWLSGGLFLAFAAAQIPIGLAFDRFGVRWPTTILMIVGVLSVFLLSVSRNIWMAVVAQAGIGIAIAPIFSGLMIYCAGAFSQKRKVMVIAIANAIGVCGSLLAGSPLGWLTEAVGWRQAVVWSAVILLVPTFGVAFFANDGNRKTELSREFNGGIRWQSTLWSIPIFLAIGVGGAFRTSWAGPYLTDSYGYNSAAIGDAMLIVSVVAVAVSFIVPGLLIRWSTRVLIITMMAIGTAAAVSLALWPSAWSWESIGALSILVAMGALHPLVVNQVRERFPAGRHGLAVSLATMWAFLSIAVLSECFGLAPAAVAWLGLSGALTYPAIFSVAAVLMAASIWIVGLERRGHDNHSDRQESPD